MVLFYAIIGGVVAGAILSRLSTGFADLASLVGRVFIAAAVVVSVPLVASQLTLALNNPRERVRRGVNQAKIMVRSLVGAVILLIVSAVTASIQLSGEGAGSVASVIGRLNPEKFMVFGTEGSVMQVLMLSVVGAVLLGALGLRATGAVTFFNRVSRASVRSFRLLLWLAPLGLLGVAAGVVSGDPAFKFAFSIDTTTPLALSLLISATGFLMYASVALGIDWMVGQLRPKRKERPGFDRGRPPQRGPRTGFQPAIAPRPQGRDRQGPQGPRRVEPRPSDLERSPFEMGVSSTPVLEIESGQPHPAKHQAPATEPTDDQGGPRRFRDRDQRPDARDGRRDRGPRGPRDRGPRGRRDDRFRGDRPDHQSRYRQDQRSDSGPTEESSRETQESSAPVVDRSAIQSELARVGEHLERMNNAGGPEKTTRTPIPESNIATPAPVVRHEVAASEPDRSGGEDEMHYGRSRHRKHERPDSDASASEPSGTVPEPVDHFSTEDMSFGRGKRRKTVK
jgi:hypothetical protein